MQVKDSIKEYEYKLDRVVSIQGWDIPEAG